MVIIQSVGGALILLLVAFIIAAIRTKPTIEVSEDTVTDKLENFEPVDCKSIMDSEMPYISYS